MLSFTSTEYHKVNGLNIRNIIRRKTKNENVIITKADKGNTVVILDRKVYVDKVNEFIVNNKIKQIIKDPTQSFSKLINKQIRQARQITQSKVEFKNPDRIAYYHWSDDSHFIFITGDYYFYNGKIICKQDIIMSFNKLYL